MDLDHDAVVVDLDDDTIVVDFDLVVEVAQQREQNVALADQAEDDLGTWGAEADLGSWGRRDI